MIGDSPLISLIQGNDGPAQFNLESPSIDLSIESPFVGGNMVNSQKMQEFNLKMINELLNQKLEKNGKVTFLDDMSSCKVSPQTPESPDIQQVFNE